MYDVVQRKTAEEPKKNEVITHGYVCFNCAREFSVIKTHAIWMGIYLFNLFNFMVYREYNFFLIITMQNI